MSTKPKIYFPHLDGLRFFCFLLVFFFHSFYSEQPHIYNSFLFRFLKERLFHNGNLGVNAFFVLSGFLITYLLIKEKEWKGKIDIPNFWIRRILRIWPLYIVCVLFGFFIFPLAKSMAGGTSTETANLFYYLGFASNFDYIQKGMPDSPGLGVLWSIAIEEQFYLVWPVVLSLFPIKKLWIPFSVIILGSWVFRATHDIPIVHEMHTLSCIGDMAIGATGAWLLSILPAFVRWVQHLSRFSIILIYASAAFILLFRQELMITHYYTRIFERSVTALVFLFIILEQCYAEKSFFKMANAKALSALGIITYGLYCIHFIIISAVTGLANKLGLNQHLWQVVLLQPAIALSLSIIIAKLSYRYFETYFLQLKNKFAYITKA